MAANENVKSSGQATPWNVAIVLLAVLIAVSAGLASLYSWAFSSDSILRRISHESELHLFWIRDNDAPGGTPGRIADLPVRDSQAATDIANDLIGRLIPSQVHSYGQLSNARYSIGVQNGMDPINIEASIVDGIFLYQIDGSNVIREGPSVESFIRSVKTCFAFDESQIGSPMLDTSSDTMAEGK